MNVESSDIVKWAGGIVTAVLAVALSIPKILRSFKSDGRDITKIEAEVDVVTLLREEVARIAEQRRTESAQFAAQIHDFQALVTNLRTHIANLEQTVRVMGDELAQLRQRTAV